MRNDAEPPFTEQTAWDYLRIFLEDFAGLFGKPADLARRADFRKQEHKVCTAWLRALEAWLRRLLLIAATRVTLAPQREAKARLPRTSATIGVGAASDDSAAWRVSFRFIRAKRKTRGKHGGTRRRPDWNPAPLALRFEALLRAAQNPDRHIARAARALAKNATLPNHFFRQKLDNMSSLRPYVAKCSFLVLQTFPEAWRPVSDTS